MLALSRRFAGLMLLVLGAWGAALPYVGPLFGYRMDGTPTFTTAHWELNLLPGIGAALAGLILIVTARSSSGLGGLLAIGSGAWFVVGPLFASTWLANAQTRVASGRLSQTLAPLGYHYGLGLLIVAIGAWVLGRLLVLAHPVGDYAPPSTATGRRRHRLGRGAADAPDPTVAEPEMAPTTTR